MAEKNMSQAILGGTGNAATSPPLKFSYRGRAFPQSLILGAGFLFFGLYLIYQAEVLNSRYDVLVFALGYGALIAGLSLYATQKNRTLAAGILYGSLFLWFIFLLGQIIMDGPLAWLHYEKMPPWLVQVLGGLISIFGMWFLIWSILNFQLLRHGHAVTITSQGLMLNDRSPAISWNRITQAQMLFNPAWPKQKTVIRLDVPGFAGTPMWPYGPIYFRRQGRIAIPIMLIANDALLIDSLTQYLGSRFEK